MSDQNQTAPQSLAAMQARIEICVAQSHRAATASVAAYEEAKRWRPVEFRMNVTAVIVLLVSFASLMVSLAAAAHVR